MLLVSLKYLLASLSLSILAFNAGAATVTWTGSASTDWFNAANWSPAQVPSSSDDAVIDRNATVTAGGGASIAFASLALGDSAGNFSPTLRLSAAQNSGGAVTIHRGAKLQQDTSQQVVFGSLTVLPGGMLTHTANSSARSFLINMSVTGDFDLQAGATVAAGALGYAGGSGYQVAGSGPGGGSGNDSSSGSGGGHGGAGGLGRNATLPAGAAYDSVTNPVDLGSGGGGAYPGGVGGRGGGAVLLNVGGNLFLNGLIAADGADGGGAVHGAGGGAGGTVNLTAAAISGTGEVRANGGIGGGTSTGQGGGGGGGGRISLVVTGTDASNLTLQANGGAGGSADGRTGGAGVIALKTSGGLDYNLTIGASGVAPQSVTEVAGSTPTFSTATLNNSIVSFAPGSTVTINSLVIAGAVSLTAATLVLDGGVLHVMTGGTLRIDAKAVAGGDLVVDGGGVFQQMNAVPLGFASVFVLPGGLLTHASNATTRSSVLNLAVSGDFDLQAGATITASGLGYGGGSGYQVSGSGPGGGPGNASSSGNGGGHGGMGGLGRNAVLPGGAAYDGITDPADLGSGGGGGISNPGGRGGGAILLSAGGSLILNGLVAADGADGAGAPHGSGGGAGGTVNLMANALSGTGVVRANGGKGAGTSGGQGGGGGGGGRISLTVASSDASNLSLSADTGAGGITDGRTGGAGVIAYKGPGATNYNLSIGGAALTALGATPLTAAPAFGAVALTNAVVTGSTMTFSSFAVSGGATMTASSLVMSVAAPLEVRSGASLNFTVQSISGGALAVRGNGTFRQMNAAPLNFGSVLVERGGLITHAANSTARSSVVNLGTSGDFDLQAGATISASGLGYSGGSGYQVAGNGPGGGPGNSSSSGSGGGHGGMGGAGSGAGVVGGATNGSAVNPTDLGSGGGGGISDSGGQGGGTVLLVAGGNVNLNGLIAADGANGRGVVHGSGGGSGGTVNIRAAAVSGMGTVRANGGAGGGQSTGQGGGGGGGGRIAVTATGTGASTVVLQVEGGAAGLANGSVGARGTIIENGVLSGGTTTSGAILAFSQMQEGVAVTKVLGETLSAQLLDFAGAVSTGVPAGSFSVAEMRLVMIKTGPFANKGFFRGRWTLALPGGSPLAGEWEGMAFFAAGDSQRLVLKGVLKGQIQGVLDGSLTESAPGSGTFDRLGANCRLVQAANTMGSSAIYLSGAGVLRDTVQYPGTVLNYLQATQAGEVGGYYSTPLDVAFSLVRVDNPGNPYQGEGFFAASYDSPVGSGSGWAYAAVSGGSARLAGVFDEALRGLMEGSLAVDSPRALFLTLQNLDAGLPLQADINVRLSLPGNVPVGGLATVIVELRNDGYAVADGVTVVAVAPEKSTFLTATGDYRSYNVTHWRGTEYAPKPFVRWDFASVPARSSRTMSYQVRLPAGQPNAYQSGVNVETITKAWADAIFANYHIGETP